MALHPDPADATLRRYLLGTLPEPEAEALEHAYFARAEALERLRGMEDDLLDDYVAGRLEADEKSAFERRYLASAPLRERVAAARALRVATAGSGIEGPRIAERPARWRVPLGIAAGLLLVILAVWSVPRRPPQSMASSVAVSEPPPPSAAPVESPASPPPTPPPGGPLASRTVVFALSPVLLRGQERTARLHVPPGTEEIELELEGDRALLPPPVSILEAVITTVEGEEVWRGEARRVRDAARPTVLASARVPARRLPPADYLLALSGRGADEGTLYSYFLAVGHPRPRVAPEQTP